MAPREIKHKVGNEQTAVSNGTDNMERKRAPKRGVLVGRQDRSEGGKGRGGVHTQGCFD